MIHQFFYATIFMNRSFSEATFTVYDWDLEEGNQEGSWSGDNGLMISVLDGYILN